jgi:hypothetical protein
VPRHRRLEQEEWEQAVLATFMPAGRLLSLPARRKKRMVVLRWLAELFRPARRYTEAEVNELLGRYHEDFASLRRFLVDEELLQRQAGLQMIDSELPTDLERPCGTSGPPPPPLLVYAWTDARTPVLGVGGPSAPPGRPISRRQSEPTI